MEVEYGLKIMLMERVLHFHLLFQKQLTHRLISVIELNNNNGNGEIQVNIKDTGTGLSPVILPKLFSKFVSTDSGGTGLGLFVSRNIVEAHGGRIWAENNANGKGATFSFIIPKAANP